MTSYDVTLAGEGDMDMERKFGWTGGIEGQSHKILSLSVCGTSYHRLLEPSIF